MLLNFLYYTEMDTLHENSVCPFCETGLVFERDDIETFQYGADENAMSLTASVIVIYCDSCDEQWTDERSEDTRQQAVEDYLATKGIYLCTICRAIPVDADDGYDTCDNCAGAF